MMLRILFFFFFFFFLASVVVSTRAASSCNKTCGSYTAPYPFGFSQGCPIHLNCSTRRNSSFQIGEFTVRNITSDSVLVDVPPDCNRSVDAAGSLFGHNYALSRRNGLLLRNCTAAAVNKSAGCSISTDVLFDRGCGRPGHDNATCFGVGEADRFSTAGIVGSGCSFLFSSVRYLAGGGGTSVPSLDLRTAELEWWLEGPCACSPSAQCTPASLPANGQRRFRCRCPEGSRGDGFAHGVGCQKVSNSKCSLTKYVSGACNGTTSKLGVLVGGIIAGASTMAALGFVCCFIRRHSSLKRKRNSMRRLLCEASCTVPLYSYKDIEKATNGFSENQILGTGAYGTVYSGKLGNDREVAVKRIKNRDHDNIEQLMNEIKLLSSVSHPNLVRLLGCCVEQGEQILVYEYMPHGTLAQHLQRERGPALPWTTRLTMATETAKAIAYLHSAVHPPIYHRDIKSSNILLDYNYSSKVADFGLSRMGMTESSHISTAPQGTPGYVDPQYHQNCHLSDKSDVYSFGVVLVEIITALKAVDFNRVQSEVNLAALATDKISRGCIDEIIDPYLEPHRDAWTLASIHKVTELAFRCLAFHRDMRPSMTEVADELEQIKLSGWAPNDDGMFMSTASSFCSSLSSRTEKSRTTSKSRRLVSMNNMIEEVNAESPVSVQDPWFSEQSSPSASSLLGNVIH